jgi:hypothetical protein
MNFSKILAKILLGFLILTFVFITFAYNTSGKPFYFVRIIEPSENVFRLKMNKPQPNSLKQEDKEIQDVCYSNLTEYNNGQRFRSTFENVEKNNPNFYATYRYFNYISTDFTRTADELTCGSYKTIEPRDLEKPIIQVFINPKDYSKDLSREQICRNTLRLVDNNVNDSTKVNFLDLKRRSIAIDLTVCEIDNN